MFSFLSGIGNAFKSAGQAVGRGAKDLYQGATGTAPRQPWDEHPDGMPNYGRPDSALPSPMNPGALNGRPLGAAISDLGQNALKAPTDAAPAAPATTPPSVSPTTPPAWRIPMALPEGNGVAAPETKVDPANHFTMDPGSEDAYTQTRNEMGTAATQKQHYSGKQRLFEALKNAGAGFLAGGAQGGTLGSAIGGAAAGAAGGAARPDLGKDFRYRTLVRPGEDAEAARQAGIAKAGQESRQREANIAHTEAQTGAIHVPSQEERDLEAKLKQGQLDHVNAQTKKVLDDIQNQPQGWEKMTVTGQDGRPHIVYHNKVSGKQIDSGLIDAAIEQRTAAANQRATEAEKNRANARSVAGMHEGGANSRSAAQIKAQNDRAKEAQKNQNRRAGIEE